MEKKVKLDEEYIQVLLLEGGVRMVLYIHTNWLLSFNPNMIWPKGKCVI